ncbi:MAG: hypothetical protein JXM79_16410 [Sedimentisphaerales bacterium]|nr:hypothetical protein [Sedimentisphaerales bacterium]
MIRWAMTKHTKFAGAALVYFIFATYLYRPYYKGLDALQLRDLFVLSTCLASLGCYVLSRRWVAGFIESFFAGVLYGFGPFSLGLLKFHPTAGLLMAIIPWLFCPAVFGPKGKWRWVRVPLALLPFAAVVLFFQVAAHFRLFPIPIRLKLLPVDLVGLMAPLVAAKCQMTLMGFYHIPISALTMGFVMLLNARRLSIMIVLAVGTVLAFMGPLLNISPIIWLVFSMLCGSIVIGAGMQGLACAGYADRKWIMVSAIVMGILAIFALLLATKYFQIIFGLAAGYARLFLESGKIYLLGAVMMGILFFIVRARLRLKLLRQLLLGSTIAMDIFFQAAFVIDRIL